MTTRVVLVADTYTSLEAVCDAEGKGQIVIRSTIPDLDVGLVAAGETPTALPEIDDADIAVRIMKPHESALEVWAYSLLGGNIYVEAMNQPLIMDSTGVSSS